MRAATLARATTSDETRGSGALDKVQYVARTLCKYVREDKFYLDSTRRDFAGQGNSFSFCCDVIWRNT